MALKKTVTTQHGIEVHNAYHRVESVSLIGKTKINFHLRSYADAEKPFFNESIMVCNYLLDGANPIKQAYEHAKTLPEFFGAEDC